MTSILFLLTAAYAGPTPSDTPLPMPSTEMPTAPLPPPLQEPVRRRSRVLLGAAAGSAVVSGALLVSAARVRNEYIDAGPPNGTEAQYRMNRGLGFTGFAMAGVAGGLTLASIRLWEW